MVKPIKIALLGVSGRMGQMLIEAINETSKVVISGASERPDHDWIGKDIGLISCGLENGILVTDRPIDVFLEADAVIDFTLPEVTVSHSALAAQARIPHIIGTTGFSKEQLVKIKLASQHAPIVRAGNMSLGVNLLTQLVKQVAFALDDSFDIEILEMHHNKKVDAPSGTALMLGEAVAEGRNETLSAISNYSREGLIGKRKKGEVGFATLRGGDVVGEHDVIFSGLGERIILRHVASDRMIFARGAVKAAIWSIGKEPSEYTMLDVLGLSTNYQEKD
jgi:4-hydroxy-tetrahydrodipicolinate reductase